MSAGGNSPYLLNCDMGERLTFSLRKGKETHESYSSLGRCRALSVLVISALLGSFSATTFHFVPIVEESENLSILLTLYYILVWSENCLSCFYAMRLAIFLPDMVYEWSPCSILEQ